jgi:hypothetical protein
MPLLFAGGVCWAVVGSDVLGAVRALVVFPEFAVVGGAAGVGSELTVGCAAFDLDSGVLALVVLPEFAAAGGVFASVPEAEVSAGFSVFVFFDFDVLAEVLVEVPLVSPAAASPPAGVALAAGSAAALFLVLLFFAGVLAFADAVVSPASAAFVLDLLLREDVPAAPLALVVLSVPVALVSAFFLLRDFFEVVDVSPDADCVPVVASALSLAGFFFFDLVAVVLLCVWSPGFAASAAGFFFLDLLAVVLLCVWSSACAASAAGFFFFFALLVVLVSLCV